MQQHSIQTSQIGVIWWLLYKRDSGVRGTNIYLPMSTSERGLDTINLQMLSLRYKQVARNFKDMGKKPSREGVIKRLGLALHSFWASYVPQICGSEIAKSLKYSFTKTGGFNL